MEMTQYQKDFVRMLDSMRVEHKGEATCLGVDAEECENCLLTNFCENDICFNAEKVIEIVTQWAKEHPIVTMADKYKEVFGVEPKMAEKQEHDDWAFYMCPKNAGFLVNVVCEGSLFSTACVECKQKFWQSAYKEPKKEVSE